VRSEWDEVKQHDVLFLLTVRPPDAGQLAEMRSRPEEPGVMELHGLVTVRGCEVVEVKDEGGSPLFFNPPAAPPQVPADVFVS
jgi:intron-binding protein aquarius